MKPIVIIFFLLWVFSGCNPYQGVYPESSPIAVTTVTATAAAVISSPRPPSSTPRPTCTVTTGVPAGSLHLRTGAGTQYAAFDVLHEGDTLIILARGAWLKVQTTQRVTGWVYGKYCR